MLSQRGMLTLAHSGHQLEMLSRWLNAMHLNGIEGDLLSPAEVRQWLPPLNPSPTPRYPVLGAVLQRRGGVARHDAVAWGYARGVGG
jgi:sarcosine oxidase, subunit beta